MRALIQLYTLSTLLAVYTEAFTVPLRQLHVTTLLPVKSNPLQIHWILPPSVVTTQSTTSTVYAASLSEGEGSSSSSSLSSSTVKDNNYDTKVAEKDNQEEEEEEEEEEEWEYEEYEKLAESDFYGSEWKVGTLMEGSKKIDETWCRCAVKDGQFIAIWGDGSDGRWNFDASSQFFSITKESFGGWLGKKIWAGTVDDYYYMEGTVRGWSPVQPASVIGQWQMKRLGVDPEEAGVAPWFERDDDDDDKKVKGSEKDDNEQET
mmetsp:Transcript_4777/g.9121  ORF Transcript_4777/g.9121 Transcript_4777/m.9121 type:complete len:262 (+) Transcript_4777:78-863(+)